MTSVITDRQAGLRIYEQLGTDDWTGLDSDSTDGREGIIELYVSKITRHVMTSY